MIPKVNSALASNGLPLSWGNLDTSEEEDDRGLA
jgi:hypothetical protein